MQHQRGLGKGRRAVLHQATNVIGVQVGAEDRVHLVGRNAEIAQQSLHRPKTRRQARAPGIDKHAAVPRAVEEGVDRNFDRVRLDRKRQILTVLKRREQRKR